MRCIEIARKHENIVAGLWLIETWDVLKCYKKIKEKIMKMINRNMRCIEMQALTPKQCI